MNKDRSISLGTLFKISFNKWRIMLICAAFFSFCGGLYRGLTLMQQINTGLKEETTADNGDYAQSVAEEALKQKQEYLAGSLLTQINPQKEGQATAIIKIRFPEQNGNDSVYVSENEKQTDTDTDQVFVSNAQSKRKVVEVINYYTNYIENSVDWTELAKKLNIEPEYLNEVVYVENIDLSMGTFSIRIINKDEEGAEEIRDYILNQISSIDHTEISQNDYELNISEKSSTTVIDPSIQTWISNRLAEMNSLETNLTTYMSNETGTEQQASSSITRGTVIKQVILFCVIGFVGGALLFVLFYSLYIVIKTRVISTREFSERYNLRPLAVIPQKDPEMIHGIDRNIIRRHADEYSSLSIDTCYQIAAQNLIASAGDYRKIAVFGDIPSGDLHKICGNIEKEINNEDHKDFYIDPIENLNNNPASLRRLADCDATLAVGRINSSEYRHMDETINTVDSYKKDILGCIIA